MAGRRLVLATGIIKETQEHYIEAILTKNDSNYYGMGYDRCQKDHMSVRVHLDKNMKITACHYTKEGMTRSNIDFLGAEENIQYQHHETKTVNEEMQQTIAYILQAVKNNYAMLLSSETIVNDLYHVDGTPFSNQQLVRLLAVRQGPAQAGVVYSEECRSLQNNSALVNLDRVIYGINVGRQEGAEAVKSELAWLDRGALMNLAQLTLQPTRSCLTGPAAAPSR